jgi:hypothetical protein
VALRLQAVILLDFSTIWPIFDGTLALGRGDALTKALPNGNWPMYFAHAAMAKKS